MKFNQVLIGSAALALSSYASAQLTPGGVGGSDEPTSRIDASQAFVATMSNPTLASFGPSARRPVVIIDQTGFTVTSSDGAPTTHGAGQVQEIVVQIDSSAILAALGIGDLTTFSPGQVSNGPPVLIDLRDVGGDNFLPGTFDGMLVAVEVGALLGAVSGPTTHGGDYVGEIVTTIDPTGPQLGGHSGPTTHGADQVQDVVVVIDVLARHVTSPDSPARPPAADPGKVEAGYSVLNGSGVNPIVFRQTSPAILGETWEATVDLGGFSAATGTLMAVSTDAFRRVPVPAGFALGELIVNPNAGELLLVAAGDGSGAHRLAVPNSTALLGSQVYMQAAMQFDGIAGPVLQMTNALEVTIGNF